MFGLFDPPPEQSAIPFEEEFEEFMTRQCAEMRDILAGNQSSNRTA